MGKPEHLILPLPHAVAVELEALQLQCEQLRRMLGGLAIVAEDGGMSDWQCMGGSLHAAAAVLDGVTGKLDALSRGEVPSDD